MTSAPAFIERLFQAFGRGIFRALHGPMPSESSPAAPPPAPRVSRSRVTRRARTRRAARVGRTAPVAPAEQAARAPQPPAAAPVRPKSGHEVVRYKQGRGSFEARIVGFDRETKLVTLERLLDGKRVQRPAEKVYSAAAK